MSYTALLVEDDAQIREIISDYFLGKEDIDIVTAADGGEGLDMIHEREFDVIMLDIMLYALGCDDYIVKPFSLAALYGKLSALLKRSGSPSRTRLVCGRISLDTVTFTVTADGRETELPPKEYALLRYFMEHKGWVIDRNTLLDKVWGEDYFGSDSVVDNHIKKLRKALGSAGTQIKTVIGGGYKIQER